MITAIPSPEQAVWYVGPIPIRAYALCILAGIVVAMWWTGKRLDARGARPDAVWDIAVWLIPFGIIGGRIYHVITTPGPYFGPGGHPMDAFKIWNGGLGIWGAVMLGAVGGWLGCRSTGTRFRDLATAVAPALPLAQAIGRWGNWFNNELYGGPTTAPWGLEIHAWDAARGQAVRDSAGNAVVLGTFQPTFLYESAWCVLISLVLVLLEKRVRLAPGQLFAAYVMLYTLGRGVIESLRIDEAQIILGLRLNVWTSVLVFLLGVALWWMWRHELDPRGPRQEQEQGRTGGVTTPS